jgi:hypothetical protein
MANQTIKLLEALGIKEKGEMSNQAMRDGITLAGGYHFFMTALSLLAAAAIFVFAVLPPLQNQSDQLAQQLFLPLTGVVFGVVLGIIYAIVGTGLLRLRNSSRMAAIFLSMLGLLSGFVGAIGSFASALTNTVNPNWVSVGMVGMATLCAYSLIAFLDIFVLIFLFNNRVRTLFYGGEMMRAAETNGNTANPITEHRIGNQTNASNEAGSFSGFEDE